MSVCTMAVRSALASAQTQEEAGAVVVVSTIAPTAAGDQLEGSLAAAEPKVAADAGTRTTEKVVAWIPTEALGVFIAIVSAFPDMYESAIRELVVVGVVTVLTSAFAFFATKNAHDRRELSDVAIGKAVMTAVVAGIAFLVWWIATPGTYVTDDLGLSNFWVFLVVTVFAAGIPYLAQALGIEPNVG